MIISDSASGVLSGIPVKGQQVYYCLSSPSCDLNFKTTPYRTQKADYSAVFQQILWNGTHQKILSQATRNLQLFNIFMYIYFCLPLIVEFKEKNFRNFLTPILFQSQTSHCIISSGGKFFYSIL